MTPTELKKILAAHAEWVARGRTGDGRAYLTGADLRAAVLRSAYLTGASLRGAHLAGAYLDGADLTGADLSGAVLRGASIDGADLSGANLRYTTLDGAYLDGANGAPRNASVQWDGHGERGRRLSAYRHSDGTDRYTCGCVVGVTLDEMRAWIEDNDAALRTSRLRALRIVADLMEAP